MLPNLDKNFQGNKGLIIEEEYSIIVSAAKNWGKKIMSYDPKKFIDDKIKGGFIKYNDSGSIIKIELKNNSLSDNIPQEIFKLTSLVELDLSDNDLSGSIPEDTNQLTKLENLDLSQNEIEGFFPDIGNLKNLVTMNLSKNDISGNISQSVGFLENLRELDVSRNEQLTGAIPSMTSKNCKVNINSTTITPVYVKPKKLIKFSDYFFLILHVLIGYADLLYDILAIIALSQSNTPIMVANTVFLVMGLFLTDKKDIKSLLLEVLHVDLVYQAYKSIKKKEQTVEMVVEQKLSAVTRSMPSMILQLCGLLRSLSITSRRNTTNLILSIGLAILGAGFTLASNSRNSGNTMFSKYFVIHYTYFISELTSRVVILGMVFFCIGSYGFIIGGLDLSIRILLCVFRLHLSSWVTCQRTDIEKSVWEGTVEAVQFFGSDYIINREDFLYVGFCINTIEMIVFLVVLNTLENPLLSMARERKATIALTVIASVTWFIRLSFYVSGLLDFKPEEIEVNRVSNRESIYLSINRISDIEEGLEEVTEERNLLSQHKTSAIVKAVDKAGSATSPNRISEIEEMMQEGKLSVNRI